MKKRGVDSVFDVVGYMVVDDNFHEVFGKFIFSVEEVGHEPYGLYLSRFIVDVFKDWGC